MKKRGQPPDSYTLSIMLTALSNYNEPKTVLPRALKLLQLFQRKDSLLKPNHIHHTQVLQICARAGDRDALWEVLSTVPDKGPDAPGSHAFAIVLEALKDPLLHENLPENEKQDLIATAIETWHIVVQRWCDGHVTMDSHLVTVMIKILALSDDPRYLEGSFDLLAQTIGVPQPPSFKTTHLPKTRSELSVEPLKPLFPAVVDPSAKLRLSDGIQLVQPTNHILTALLQIPQKLHRPDIATYYWEKLTQVGDLNLKADNAALKVYLNILAANEEYEKMLAAIKSFAHLQTPDFGAYRIAMAAFSTAKSRPLAFDLAMKLYYHRHATHKELDMKVIETVVMRLLPRGRHDKRVDWLKLVASDAATMISKGTNSAWACDETTVTLKERKLLRRRSCAVAKVLVAQIDVLTNPPADNGDKGEAVSLSVFARSRRMLSGFVEMVEGKKRVVQNISTVDTPGWKEEKKSKATGRARGDAVRIKKVPSR
jgi:hypothetical protein